MTGSDIKTLRAQLGLTQAELAAQLNKIDPNLRIYPSSVSRWENGHVKELSLHTAAALGILARRGVSDHPGAVALTASEHMELAAAGFEADGSLGLAAAIRGLAARQRESEHDLIQITPDGMTPH